jgi:hypothetical protein
LAADEVVGHTSTIDVRAAKEDNDHHDERADIWGSSSSM